MLAAFGHGAGWGYQRYQTRTAIISNRASKTAGDLLGKRPWASKHDISRLHRRFNQEFLIPHRAYLPRSVVAAGKPWSTVCHNLLTIQVVFGRDRRGAYMQIYTSHQMGGDTHSRWYAKGKTVGMPAHNLFGFNDENTQRVNASLEEAGFVSEPYDPKGSGGQRYRRLRRGRRGRGHRRRR